VWERIRRGLGAQFTDRLVLVLVMTAVGAVRFGAWALIVGPGAFLLALGALWSLQATHERILRGRYPGLVLPAQLLAPEGDCTDSEGWRKAYRPRLLERHAESSAGIPGLLVFQGDSLTWKPSSRSLRRGAHAVECPINDPVAIDIEDLYPRGRISCLVKIKVNGCTRRLMTQHASALRTRLSQRGE
jgi:hypothetical protein